jgi:ActR/RegA family two-component response regulator
VATSLLVVSPSESLGDSLVSELPRDRFDVWFSRPGAQVLAAVVGSRPQIAVVDAIDARPEAAQLEIALLKSFCPEARVIVVSRCSSGADASVVEQGVFYYMAAPSKGELVRAVESAALAGPSESSTS